MAANLKSALFIPIYINSKLILVLEFYSIENKKHESKLLTVANEVRRNFGRIFGALYESEGTQSQLILLNQNSSLKTIIIGNAHLIRTLSTAENIDKNSIESLSESILKHSVRISEVIDRIQRLSDEVR
jgi:hypothetical protein